MGKQTLNFLKGSNRNFDNVLDSYLNLTDGGTVASKTAFSGGLTTGIKSTDATAGFVNDMHLSGLNPTWAVNFGGILKGQADCTENLLTNANEMLQLSYALEGLGKQAGIVTAAQASVIFGGTGVAGVDYPVAAGTPASANLKVVRLTGNYDDVALTIPDLATDKHQTLFIFTDNVLTAGGVLSFQFNAANEFDAASCENFTSTDGGTVMTRVAALTEAHNQLILTNSAHTTTLLAGSFIYCQANNDTDQMSIKSCIRTSGGTVAITEANND
tara:strand:- start:58 stop:873 length:816 start_codon:yes stop_codon:yes gene_type:complete